MPCPVTFWWKIYGYIMQIRMIGEPEGVVEVYTRWKRQKAKMLPGRDQGPLHFFDSYKLDP